MTNRMRGVLGALGLAVVMSACGGDGGGPSGSSGTMSATIDGQAWTATLAVAATYEGNVLSFAGTDGNARQINIALPNVTSTGTVNLGVGQMSVAVVTVNTTEAYTSSGVGGTGTVNITSLSSSGAKGTFSFTGIRATGTGGTTSLNVTNGQFDVKF